MPPPAATRQSRGLVPGGKARSAIVSGCLLTGLLATAACWNTAVVMNEPSDLSQAIYVAPDGAATGNGSKERPLDLNTALSGAAPIRPGGTIWLRGGTYRVTAITSALAGAEDAPITVRSLPGEHAVLDGARAAGAVLTLNGAWTVFRDFEITNSDPLRSGDRLERADGINVHGANVKVVNLIIHDLAGIGLGIWSDAVDTEAYGNIIYHNGWLGSDRPHGHGIYTQNKTGVRLITDNVIFGQFGMGIHAYASDEGFLDDMQFEGNVVDGNGVTAPTTAILVGGHRSANRAVLKSNYTYDKRGPGNNVGYSAGCADMVMKDNYFVANDGYSVQLVNCDGVLEGNVFIGGMRAIAGQTIVTHPEVVAQHPANDFVTERPSATRTFVRPNRYSPGRAHVIVYNWELAKDVQVDLAAASLPIWSAYEIRDVRNLAAPPIVSGTYSGRPVTIPLEGLTAAPMINWQPTPPHTAPEFAVFLVTRGPDDPSIFRSLVARMSGLLGN